MGNQTSNRSAGSGEFADPSLTRNVPLGFHRVHSEHVHISTNKRRAKRVESFCKGIAFSNRPIAVGERVYIRFAELSTSWSGVLRMGFTNHDPSTLSSAQLPRYACPDLTNKPGYWAKALGERYAEVNNILFYYVTRSGDVIFGVNGQEKGQFFSGVDTSKPLWGLVDIYGNTIAVEYMDGRQQQGHVTLDPSTVMAQRPSLVVPPPKPISETHVPVIKYHASVHFVPFPFHRVKGINVTLNSDRTVATRLHEEYCNAYVFSERPLRCGQKVVIQVLGIERSYVGGLAFGVTACDPASITDPGTLPDDSDNLLDRPEYWVVNKDVCTNSENGDELSFTLTNEGEIQYGKNGHHIAVLMHVDKTLPLWPFFDVYGNTQKIKMLGLAGPRMPRPPNPTNVNPAPSLRVSLPPAPGQGSSRANSLIETAPAVPPRDLPPLLSRHSIPGETPSPRPEPRTLRSRSPVELATPPPRLNLPAPLIPLTVTTPSGTANTSLLEDFTGNAVNTELPEAAPRNTTVTTNTSGLINTDSPDGTTVPRVRPILASHPSMTSVDMDNALNADYDCNECTVCYEKQVDSVLYTCGHMCMCYDCAIDVKNDRGALCPICRQEIKDVIKTYRP